MFFKKKRKEEKAFNPETDTGIDKPVRTKVAVGDVNDKYSTYPSNGLTPKRLARILRAADDGDVLEQMELFEEMEEKDPHLFSQLQTRKLAVTGLDWEVQAFSDDERDKEVADFIDRQLKGIENLDNIFIDMLDAIGKGISVMEIEWGIDANGANIIENIEYVHPKKLVWNSQMLDGELRETQTANYFSDVYPIDCTVSPANALFCRKNGTLLQAGNLL